MKKLNRKGCTIVELVIVIAVIAILAAVLIPTMSNLIKTAQTSADVTLVKNVNLILATERATEGKNATMQEALDDALEGGYDVKKLTPTNSDNHILWDQESDNFVLFANGKYNNVGADVDVENLVDYKLWQISETTDGAIRSIYYIGDETEVTVNGVGFDAGTSSVATVNYTNTTGEPKNVVIRTNSANTNLNIDAATDTVNHYGNVGKVDAVAIDMNCYNEYGTAAYVKVTAGKVVVKAGGEIAVAFANNENSANAVVTVDGGSVEQGYTLAADAGSSNVALTQKAESEVEALADDAIKEALVEEILVNTSNITTWIEMPLDDVTLEGTGSEADPYKITNALQLALVAKNVNNNVDDGAYAGAYYKLMNNINLESKGWTPIGTGLYPFHGNFDGNGKTISNVEFDQKYIDTSSWGQTDGAKNEGFAYGFFGVIGWKEGAHAGEKVTIANLTLNVDFQTNGSTALGGLVGADAAAHKGSVVNSSLACDIEITNITVNGKVIASNATGSTVGGVVGKLYTKGNIAVDGCINNAEVKSESTDGESKLGGILGFFSGASNATITNNTNNGDISSLIRGRNKAAGICLSGATSSSINISGNKNTGDITGSSYAVAAIAFSANDKPIYQQNHTVENNENSGTLYSYDSVSGETTKVLYSYLVYGGKSQTPADNTTDDVKYDDGTPVLEINQIVAEQ